MLAPEGFGIVIIGAVLLFTTPDATGPPDSPHAVVPAPAEADRPAPEGDWISLTGEVHSITPQRFQLRHGRDEVTVDLHGGLPADAHLLLRPGDTVTVRGILDSRFYSRRQLQADTVHLPRLDSYIFTDLRDAGDLAPSLLDGGAGGGMAVTGVVAGIQGRRLTLYSGGGTFTIDTSAMADDPTRRSGEARVDIGDRIAAAGDSDAADGAGRPGLSASRISVLPPS